MHVVWGGLLVAALAAALAVEPAWPARVIALPLWMGGYWRTWLAPLCVAGVAAITAANTAAPGSAWAATRAFGRAVQRRLPLAAAAVLAYVTLLLTASAVTVRELVRGAAVLALQLALYPETPLVALSVALGVVLLRRDARGARALDSARTWWWRISPRLRGTARRAAPPILAAVASGAFAAAVFPAAMRGWARPDPPDAQAYNLYRSFFNFSIYEDDRLEQRSGFGLGLRGLTLQPGQEGSIVFRLDRPAQSAVLLRTDFYNRRLAESGTALSEATFPNRLELSAGPSAPFQPVLEDTSVGEIVGGRVLDVTPLVRDARVYRLRFSARNTTDGEVTVLPSFSISTAVDPAAVPHPAFPVVAYAAAGAAAGYLLLRAAGRSATGAMTGALVTGAALASAARLAARLAPIGDVASAGAGGALIFDPANPADVEMALRAARAALGVVVVGGLAWAVAARRRGESPRWAAAMWVACAVVLAIALDARWQELMRVRYEQLLPDAMGYQAIGAEFPSKMARYRSERPSALLDALYDSGFDGRASAAAVFYAGGNNGREPGWPALLRLTYNVLGVSAFHTRLTSLALAALLAALTCWLGWRTLHPAIGVTGGALYALNPPQIVNSVAGLREELVAVFLVALVAVLFARNGRARPSRARQALAGAAAAGMVLVRADMLVLAGLVLTLGALALRWRVREWLVAGAVAAALAGPMYVGYAFTHRDPFYPGTYGATVNRNLEFPERMGTPGFPSAEEYAANWAAGPRISPMTYFFVYHSLPQFVEYSVRGFVRIFPTILFRDQPVALWLCVAGLVLLLLRRRWLVPAAVVLSLAPFYAFMAGVPNPWVFAPRYAHHALPFAVLAAAYAVWCVPLWLAGRLVRNAARTRGGMRELRLAGLEMETA